MPHTSEAENYLKFSSNPDLSTGIEDQEYVRNINLRKRKNPEQEMFTSLKEELMQSFKQMIFIEISEIKKQNTQILESNAQIKELLELNTANYKEISRRVETLETKHGVETTRVDELENQLNELQKQFIKNTVEIRNIPWNDKEEVQEIVKSIYKTLNIPPVDEMVNTYRKGKQNGPIIMEYQDGKGRETIIKAAKRYNSENKSTPLNSEILGISGVTSRVYISVPLTPIAKKMLVAGRELVKNGTYKYCWASRGNILLRKEEGQPPVVVKSLNQIKSLVKQ